MKKKLKQYSFILILLSCTVLLGLNYYYQPFFDPTAKDARQAARNQQQAQENPPTATSSAETGEIVATAIKLQKLSPEQRVAQLLAVPLIFDSSNSAVPATSAVTATSAARTTVRLQALREPYPTAPGFFTVFGSDIPFEVVRSSIVDLKNQYFSREVLPLVAVDHEGGTVQRLSGEGFTRFPSWQDVCKLPEEERLALLEVVARELAKSGIDIVLGPVVDVGTSTALRSRICSNEYPLTALVAYEFSYALNQVGVLPVIKHFPGIGMVNQDLHTDFAQATTNDNDLKLYDFLLTELERVAVMVGHIGVAGLGDTTPCSLSAECVARARLKNPELLVISDALEMSASMYDAQNPAQPKTLLAVSREALLAGSDVLLYGPSVTQEEILAITAAFVREYEYDSEFQQRVDQSVLRILEYKATDR